MRILKLFDVEADKMVEFEAKEGWDEAFIDAESLQANSAKLLLRPLLALYKKYPNRADVYAAFDVVCHSELTLSEQYHLYKLVNKVQLNLLRGRK